VITGRPVASALELAGFAGVPGLERLTILGHYGAERWDAATGELRTPPPHPGVLALREELPAIVAGAPDGVRIEDKGAALAVHTRRTANPDAVLHALEPELLSAAERLGLAVEPGRFVLELRPPGTDKGDALRAYLAERDAASVLYAGDDLGDIAAFDAVAQWRKDGNPGLLVCAAPTTGEAPVTALASRADLIVQGPEGVVALLGSLAERF
jgi:trehalose 6-phosphate phosphatase